MTDDKKRLSEDVAAFIKLLKKDSESREAGIRALGYIKYGDASKEDKEKIVESIKAALRDESENVREAAGHVLESIINSRTDEEKNETTGQKMSLRERAAKAIDKLKDPETIDSLLEAAEFLEMLEE